MYSYVKTPSNVRPNVFKSSSSTYWVKATHKMDQAHPEIDRTQLSLPAELLNHSRRCLDSLSYFSSPETITLHSLSPGDREYLCEYAFNQMKPSAQQVNSI